MMTIKIIIVTKLHANKIMTTIMTTIMKATRITETKTVKCIVTTTKNAGMTFACSYKRRGGVHSEHNVSSTRKNNKCDNHDDRNEWRSEEHSEDEEKAGSTVSSENHT